MRENSLFTSTTSRYNYVHSYYEYCSTKMKIIPSHCSNFKRSTRVEHHSMLIFIVGRRVKSKLLGLNKRKTSTLLLSHAHGIAGDMHQPKASGSHQSYPSCHSRAYQSMQVHRIGLCYHWKVPYSWAKKRDKNLLPQHSVTQYTQ